MAVLRSILGVVGGYIVMGLLVFAVMSVSFLVLGVERVYKPGVYDISMLWVGVATAISFIAGVCGGAVTGLITRRRGAVMALAALTFILGLYSAFANMKLPAESEPRAEDVAVFEAASKTRQPAGYAFSLPVIGVVSVMVGGIRFTRPKRDAPVDG